MRKNAKAILVTLLVLVLIFSMVGCSKPVVTETAEPSAEVPEAKTPTIAVLIPGPVGYFVAVRKGIDEAAAKYKVKIEYADADWDSAKQLSQVEDFISKQVDMIAVCSVDAEAVKPAVDAAKAANIPILAFTNAVGTDPTGKYDGLVSYVGQNEVKTGELCGKIALQLLGDKGGDVVMIEGRPGTPPQINRREGFINAIKAQSNVKDVYTQTSNWEKEQAMKIVEDLIQKKMNMDLIFCQDDNSAIGAGMALQEAGLKERVYVIGLGGSIDGLQAIKDGLMDCTTFMSAAQEGFVAIETCSKYLKGEKVESVTEIVQVEVNKDNIDKFKGEW